jgi:hypothetical protein
MRRGFVRPVERPVSFFLSNRNITAAMALDGHRQ